MAYALAVRRSPQPHDLHYSRHSPWLGRSAARSPRCRNSRSLGTTIAPVLPTTGDRRRVRIWRSLYFRKQCGFGDSGDAIDHSGHWMQKCAFQEVGRRHRFQAHADPSRDETARPLPNAMALANSVMKNPRQNGLTHKSARHVAAHSTT